MNLVEFGRWTTNSRYQPQQTVTRRNLNFIFNKTSQQEKQTNTIKPYNNIHGEKPFKYFLSENRAKFQNCVNKKIKTLHSPNPSAFSPSNALYSSLFTSRHGEIYFNIEISFIITPFFLFLFKIKNLISVLKLICVYKSNTVNMKKKRRLLFIS